MKEKEALFFCDKCGGPVEIKKDSHYLKNDEYSDYLIVKKYKCRWCGRERIVNTEYR